MKKILALVLALMMVMGVMASCIDVEPIETTAATKKTTVATTTTTNGTTTTTTTTTNGTTTTPSGTTTTTNQGNPTCNTHVDGNGDYVCDNCGEPLEDHGKDPKPYTDDGRACEGCFTKFAVS